MDTKSEIRLNAQSATRPTPDVLVGRIRDNFISLRVAAGTSRSALFQEVTQDVLTLDRNGFARNPRRAEFLHFMGVLPSFRRDLCQKLQQDAAGGDPDDLSRDLRLAALFGLSEYPESQAVVEEVRMRHERMQQGKAQRPMEQAAQDRPARRAKTNRKHRGFFGKVLRYGAAGAQVLALGSVGLASGRAAYSINYGQQGEVAPIVHDSSKVFHRPTATGVAPSPSPIAPVPTAEPPPEATAATEKEIEEPNSAEIPKEMIASPTPRPEKPLPRITIDIAPEKVGNKIATEYFFGPILAEFKNQRIDRWNADPSVRERLSKEAVMSDDINLLVLGVDEYKERSIEYSGAGMGRADIVKLISINPRTMKITIISIPRDMYSPEVEEFVQANPAPFAYGGPRINNVTMIPQEMLPEGTTKYDVARKILETATNRPVDVVWAGSVDLFKGNEDIDLPSLLDRVFPEGLPIEVAKTIVDDAYPDKGYGTKVLRIEAGKHEMRGQELTEYARTRHSTSEADRVQRQSQIIKEGLKKMLWDSLNFLRSGQTTRFDNLLDGLDEQENAHNFFQDVDFVQVMKDIRDTVRNLYATPEGQGILLRLGKNSQDLIGAFLTSPGDYVRNISLNSDKDIAWAPRDVPYGEYMEIINGGDAKVVQANADQQVIQTRASQYGNYVNYWTRLRQLSAQGK